MSTEKKPTELFWKIAVVILLAIVAVQLYWLRQPSVPTPTAVTEQTAGMLNSPPVKPLGPPAAAIANQGINPYDQPQLRSGADMFREMQQMVDQMMQEMDRETPMHLMGAIPPGSHRVAYGSPAMANLPDKFVVKLEIPGLEKSNIDASVTDNVLNITGKQENSVDNRNGATTSSSSSISHFQTSLYLPEPVKAEELKVDCNGNTVTITIPKKV